MGAQEVLVGLTKKSVELLRSTRAAWKEFITEENPEGLMIEKGPLQAVKRRFDGLWNRAGVRRTVALDGILGVLMDGPKTFGEIFDLMKNDPEFGDDFQNLDRKVFTKSIRQLLDADLITGDRDRMWVLG